MENEFPRYYQNVKNARELLPNDWEIRIWDEKKIKNLLATYPIDLVARFDDMPHMAMKADIARIVILKEFGGVYIDCDFILRRNLEPLCHLDSQPYIALRKVRFGSFIHSMLNGTISPVPETLQNYILISPKGNPLWDIMVEHLSTFRNRRPLENRAIYYTRYTCLNALGRSVHKYRATEHPVPIIFLNNLSEHYGLHVGKGTWAGALSTYGAFKHRFAEELHWPFAISLLLNATLIFCLAILLMIILLR